MKTIQKTAAAIHAPIAHESAAGHVTGSAVYIDDIPVPEGTLHAALVLSPHAHARIVAIDDGRAAARDGVRAVLGAEDIPGRNDAAPIFADEPILAPGVATYAGQPVAMVVADTRNLAISAAAAVEVAYQPRPPVLEISAALAQGSFVSTPLAIERGHPARAIAAARHRLSGSFSCGGQDHFYLEGQVALAVPLEDDQMLVYSSTQHPREVQHIVARVLGRADNAITTETRRLGGGFGGKESQASIIAALAALAADACARPVKLRLARDDDMLATGKRHDFLYQYEVGFDDCGRIEGIDLVLASRAGNVADLSSPVLNRALHHVDNCYFLPNIGVRGYPCRTNTVSNTAFRGFGGPQGMLAIETVIDEIARHLVRDPDAVRRVNYYGSGERAVTHYGQVLTDNIIEAVVDRLGALADYEARKSAVAEFNRRNQIVKKGIALMPSKFGISFNLPELNQAGALVHVYTDGSVHLSHGGVEMGQGLFIKVAQVVAQTLGVGIERVRNSATRTDKVPNTSATSASSGSDLNGMAARDAALKIRARMAQVAAAEFGVEADAVEFERDRIRAGDGEMSFEDLAALSWRRRISLSATGFYATPKIGWDEEHQAPRPFFYFSYGAGISEVAVDTLTGETRVLRADILQDCGSSLNPAVDIGQIEGGYVQGQGWMTMEELWWNEEGALATHGPSTYKIPGSRDVPPEFNVHILPASPNREPTIYRSKAIGEPPLMLSISVLLAIRDAIASLANYRQAPQLSAPATPQAVLAAVEGIRRCAPDGRR